MFLAWLQYIFERGIFESNIYNGIDDDRNILNWAKRTAKTVLVTGFGESFINIYIDDHLLSLGRALINR